MYRKTLCCVVAGWMMLLPDVGFAWDSPRTSCAGPSPCNCPDGTHPMADCNQDCYSLCGLNSGGGSGGISPDVEMARQLGSILGKALANSIKGNAEEAARREKEAAELKRQQDIQNELRKQEEMLRQEQATQRLLGELKGTETSGELGLKLDSDSGLELKTGDSSAYAPLNTGGSKPGDGNEQPKSDAYSKGYSDAGGCYSQNAGNYCMSVSNDQQICLADYRAGYASGEKLREQLMNEAFLAGQRAGSNGELANGASDERAQGPCRTEWIQAYNRGHFQGKPHNAQK